MENGKIKCNLCNEEYWFGLITNGQLWREKRCDKRKAGVDMEAIFIGAITWAITGICHMIYSEY